MSKVRIPDPRDVIIKPVISEKSYGLLDQSKYTFEVRPDANKSHIKLAVAEIFGVKVTSVNTLNRQGKRRRTRQGWGKRKDVKHAIVTVEGDASRLSDIFGGSVA
ncbi:MAG TPA: 50S ribosomal protein L23 [Stackebrandtia sp.]|jgi:large subunit ribosomal protein L23|uniref:50S ribosomal protein L23 n=1 Tax=Stackebrandtia sp. TaxID=2023065 RepID=UPI002D40A89F|nr:50S ribosomal protein L23 [Stackebrandtia sp.]HZE39946.1 50S ribosomal protein L23 [Stackebrandtia sp.]